MTALQEAARLELQRRENAAPAVEDIAPPVDVHEREKQFASRALADRLGLDPEFTYTAFDATVRQTYGEILSPQNVIKKLEDEGYIARMDEFGFNEDLQEAAASIIEQRPMDFAVERRMRAQNIANHIYDAETAFRWANQYVGVNEMMKLLPDAPPAEPGLVQMQIDTEIPDEDLLRPSRLQQLMFDAENIQEARQIAQLAREAHQRYKYSILNGEREWMEFTQVHREETTKLIEFTKAFVKSSSSLAASGLQFIDDINMSPAGETAEKLREYAERPEFVGKNPEDIAMLVVQQLGSASPYFLASMTGSGIAGSLGSFTVGYVAAKDRHYQEAISQGADPQRAEIESLIVGLTNGAIEMSQVGKIFKFMKGGLSAFTKKTAKNAIQKVALGLADTAGQAVKLSVMEGLEELSQEGVSMSVSAISRGEYPRNPDGSTDWEAIMDRLGSAYIGGATVGPIFGAAGRAWNSYHYGRAKNHIANYVRYNYDLENGEAGKIASNVMDQVKYGVPIQDAIAHEMSVAVISDTEPGGDLNNSPVGNPGKKQTIHSDFTESVRDEVKTEKPKPQKPKKVSDIRIRGIDVGKMAENAVDGIDYLFGTVSSRLRDIDEGIFKIVRNEYTNPLMLNTQYYMDLVVPFLKKYKKFSSEDKYIFEKSRLNGMDSRLDELVEKYNLHNEYSQYRQAMDEIFDESTLVGMNVEYRDVYFSRVIKDFDKLLKVIENEESHSPISAAIESAKQRSKGRSLSQEEKAKIILSMLRGYTFDGIQLKTPGNAKTRKIFEVTDELAPYYHGFEESTRLYIEGMAQAIQQRRLFAKETDELNTLRGNLSRAKTNLYKLENGLSNIKDPKKLKSRIRVAKKTISELESQIELWQDRPLEDTIGGWISELDEQGKLSSKQQRSIVSMLKSVMRPKGTNKFLKTLQGLEYGGSLAQIPALITQYGENILSLLRSPKSVLPAFVRAHLNKSNISLKSLGVTKIGQEFADPSLNKFLNGLLIPFEYVDRVGKETYINTVVKKYRQLATKNPDKLTQHLKKSFFDAEIDGIIESLASGKIDENVKLVALNEIGNVQPISMIEVPQGYLDAGNARIFYMYKTFMIKRLDILRNNGFNQIIEGARNNEPEKIVQGIASLVWLTFMFVLADSTMDVVKDFVKGKPLDKTEDYLIDNLLQTFMLNKYSVEKGVKQGPKAFLQENIFLPVGNLDTAFRDIKSLMDEDSEKGSEAVTKIPYVGQLYYWWTGEGKRKIEEGVYEGDN